MAAELPESKIDMYEADEDFEVTSIDAELSAIAACVAALETVDQAAQQRALVYLNDRYARGVL